MATTDDKKTTTTTTTGQGKEKLTSIMDAASALTSLGDEESTGGAEETPTTTVAAAAGGAKKEAKEPKKRYIPEHKKPDAALTFPEKMMNLMKFAEEQPEGFCIAWLPDGKSFVIRNPDLFTRQVLPKFFKATKFSSFTRKLYRWGFRQVNRGIGPDDPIIFGNEHFQRDNAEEMSKMRSITAASSRKAEAQTMYCGAPNKRPLDAPEGVPDHKRLLLDHLLQQKAAVMHNHPGLYAGFNPAPPTAAVSLTSALRPSLGLGHVTTQNHFSGGLPAMMSKHMDIMGQQNNNLIGNYMPKNSTNNQGQTYATTTSTADIVNAAISALRYAS